MGEKSHIFTLEILKMEVSDMSEKIETIGLSDAVYELGNTTPQAVTEPQDRRELPDIFAYDHKHSTERIRRIMHRVGMPESTSLYLCLAQFEAEIIIELREKLKTELTHVLDA